MLFGYLDEITSSGFFLGWATNKAQPSKPLTVSIRNGTSEEIAWGLAHHYRKDLAEAGIGLGWCAFRLRASFPIDELLQDRSIMLCERASEIMLHRPEVLTMGQEPVGEIRGAETLIATDPTVIIDIDQLRGCEALFSRFIKARGVSNFVRTAYVYVLARPVDDEGLAVYAKLIRKAAMQPFELLAILADSDEFRSRPRSLGAPNTPTFPFHCD